MPSLPRSPSRFLSVTSLALVLAGCGDDDGTCGPGEEPAGGVTVEAVTFGDLRAGANNDCPTDGHPTAITIQGGQVDPAVDGQFLVLCLPRPDEIGSDPISFDDTDRVQVVDFFGQDEGDCELRFDRSRPATAGAVTFAGFCDDGVHGDGFAISLSGSLPFTRDCGDGPDEIIAGLGGRAAVGFVPAR
jgi:hypothetical protein